MLSFSLSLLSVFVFFPSYACGSRNRADDRRADDAEDRADDADDRAHHHCIQLYGDRVDHAEDPHVAKDSSIHEPRGLERPDAPFRLPPWPFYDAASYPEAVQFEACSHVPAPAQAVGRALYRLCSPVRALLVATASPRLCSVQLVA